MTVEEIRGSVVCNNEVDKFPIGMRVLAVDDNPTCLKVLDGLLRKCQYHVTTTNEAITALKMLRENRNRFDLIISDVCMPDMDGFKLLELVGLEMDLPVIMLSGNSDPKLVMKGITHGACDYLVKPVRLEELRNIWQHVIRRKVETKSQSKSNNNETSNEGNEGVDQIAKMNRKRKDEDDDDENGNDSDDPSSTQKRPRVVWSIELHKKFVFAVNQLGIEKAVPKRILDLMNVDGLTRENVASHLQKYRLYLRRISQHANMIFAFGGSNDASSYMRMNTLDRIGDFRTVSNSGRSPNSVYGPSGMLGRLNSTSGVTLQSLTAPPFVQPNHTQNKLQASVSSQPPNHQNMSLLSGISPSFVLDNQQYENKPNVPLIQPNHTQNKLQESVSSQPPNHQKMSLLSGISPSFVLDNQQYGNEPNTPLSQPNHTQNKLQESVSSQPPNHQNMSLLSGISPSFVFDNQQYGNKPNVPLIQPNHTQIQLQASVSSEPPNHQKMNLLPGIPPSFDLGNQQYENKPNVQLTDFGSFEESQIFPGTKLADFTSIDESQMLTDSRTFVDPIAVPASQSSLKLPSTDSESFNLLSGGSCFLDQDCPNSASFSSNQLPTDENYSYTTTVTGGFGSNITTAATIPLEANGGSGFVSDIVPNVNQSLPNQYQRSQNCGNLDYSQYSHNTFSSSPASGLAGVGGGLSGLMNHSRSNGGASTLVQIQSPSMRSNEDYLVDQTKLQGGFFASNGYGSLDDIMTGMMKKEQEQEPTSIMAGDFGYDHYTSGLFM